MKMKIENAKVGMEVQVKDNILLGSIRGKTGRIKRLRLHYPGVDVDIDGRIYDLHISHLRIVNKKLKCKTDCKNYEPVKAWPDTFEEAMKLSEFWGLEVFSKRWGGRYIIVNAHLGRGCAINITGQWTANKLDMNKYWKANGSYENTEYIFKQFKSAAELYQWLLDGEK